MKWYLYWQTYRAGGYGVVVEPAKVADAVLVGPNLLAGDAAVLDEVLLLVGMGHVVVSNGLFLWLAGWLAGLAGWLAAAVLAGWLLPY